MDYEHLPGDPPLDETDVSLRASSRRISDEQLAGYDPGWSDEQLMAWDGNFRSRRRPDARLLRARRRAGRVPPRPRGPHRRASGDGAARRVGT